MKVEVGMYVRTKDGIIAKCTEIRVNRYMFDRIILENGYYNDWEFIDIPEEKSLIKKASHNIIDLIEVGDYVNGVRVERIDKDPFIKGQINLWTDEIMSNYWGDISLTPIRDKDIKSIVTKEQFEAMAYKVV